MSTSLSQAHLTSLWKQEVNQRVAAHKSRKGAGGAEPETGVETRPSVNRRAAEAAARVAARYANVPSYNEMLADEARAALRAAEAASKAALEAQAAAASVLAGIEATAGSEPAPEPQFSLSAIHVAEDRGVPEAALANLPSHGPDRNAPPRAAAWPLDRAELPVEHAIALPAPAPLPFAAGVEDGRKPAPQDMGEGSGEEIPVIEPGQPIHGNLIEFPRQLVAARKARPRRAEGPYAALEAGTQLSIFEVDPAAISTQPEAAAAGLEKTEAPAWIAPEWSEIELEPQPQSEAEEILEEPAAELAASPEIEPAPVSRRLMAAVVDAALILAAVLAAAVMAANHTQAFPGKHEAGIWAGLALLIAAAAYQALFFTLGQATPGMRYAQIKLCTLDGQNPTCAQRRRRLAALLLSVLPVGLGFGWALFDDDHLTWHDRLSGTYPRQY